MQRNSKILLGLGPRRFGKSISQAMLAFSYALVVVLSKQAIFSTSERISKYMGELIYKSFCDSGKKDRVARFGDEQMVIHGLQEDEKRIIYYYPSNPTVCFIILLLLLLFSIILSIF
jgi:hypothetical protein